MFGTPADVKKPVRGTQWIVRDWLEKLAQTANSKDLAAHMALIAKYVKVFSIPAIELIDYEDWAAQCEQEFERGILKAVSYPEVRVCTATPHVSYSSAGGPLRPQMAPATAAGSRC